MVVALLQLMLVVVEQPLLRFPDEANPWYKSQRRVPFLLFATKNDGWVRIHGIYIFGKNTHVNAVSLSELS